MRECSFDYATTQQSIGYLRPLDSKNYMIEIVVDLKKWWQLLPARLIEMTCFGVLGGKRYELKGNITNRKAFIQVTF